MHGADDFTTDDFTTADFTTDDFTTAALTTDTFMRLQEYKRRALEEKDGLTAQMKALKEEVLSLLALLYEALSYWCVRPYGRR